MPEGDTIHKVARFMAPRLKDAWLIGCQVHRIRLPQLEKQQIKRVFAHGKHLFIDCSRSQPSAQEAHGFGLRVHLGMHGSWHAYPPGSSFRRPAWQASVVMTLADQTRYVCFNAEDVELIDAAQLPGSALTWRFLGPDLLEESPDFAHIDERVARRGDGELLIDLLLNQRVAAGIGNVYKCELMFLHALPIDTRLNAQTRKVTPIIYARAAKLLRQNLGGWPRTTTCDRRQLPRDKKLQRPRLWVYGRGGMPCLICGHRLMQQRMGHKLRQTFWCTCCQSSWRDNATHQLGLMPAVIDAFSSP